MLVKLYGGPHHGEETEMLGRACKATPMMTAHGLAYYAGEYRYEYDDRPPGEWKGIWYGISGG